MSWNKWTGKRIDKREEKKRKFGKNRNNKKLNGNKIRKINVVTCNRYVIKL